MNTEQSRIASVLQSRKFWSAVVGLAAIIYMSWANGETLDPDTVVNAILGIVAAYMATTAWEDTAREKAAGAAATTTISTPSPEVTVTTSDAPIVTPKVETMGLQ